MTQTATACWVRAARPSQALRLVGTTHNYSLCLKWEGPGPCAVTNTTPQTGSQIHSGGPRGLQGQYGTQNQNPTQGPWDSQDRMGPKTKLGDPGTPNPPPPKTTQGTWGVRKHNPTRPVAVRRNVTPGRPTDSCAGPSFIYPAGWARDCPSGPVSPEAQVCGHGDISRTAGLRCPRWRPAFDTGRDPADSAEESQNP